MKKSSYILINYKYTLPPREQYLPITSLLTSQTMFYTANRTIRDEYLAEDIVHQAFLRIIVNLDKINEINCHKKEGQKAVGLMVKMLTMIFRNLLEM